MLSFTVFMKILVHKYPKWVISLDPKLLYFTKSLQKYWDWSHLHQFKNYNFLLFYSSLLFYRQTPFFWYYCWSFFCANLQDMNFFLKEKNAWFYPKGEIPNYCVKELFSKNFGLEG